MEQSYHYQLIARALREIDARPGIGLEDLAARLSMSPAHFQKVFSAWVGVSPKKYQQYLALGQAKEMLATRHTVLETALETGLSGPSRLHDLFLTWEAMSPGDYARGGEGLTIFWGWFDSPFGRTAVCGTTRGLCGMGFAAEMGEAALSDLLARWPRAVAVEDPARLRPWVEAAFAGRQAPLVMLGAPFQIKVWEALLSVPSGHVTTYSDLAAAVGAPRAVRAVGTAVGRNPISFLIPCHRALRKSGELGGYHWGLPVKRALLAWEAARAEAGSWARRRRGPPSPSPRFGPML